jgi:hypothetical protein
VRALPHLREFYPGICLTTAEKARKNLSQGKINLSKVKKNFSQSTYYENIHTLQPLPPPTHTHTHTHITKQYKPTTVQIKTDTVQDIPK